MADSTPITKADLDESLRQFSQEIKEYIDERTHDAETRLLRAFSEYNNSASVRFPNWKPTLII